MRTFNTIGNWLSVLDPDPSSAPGASSVPGLLDRPADAQGHMARRWRIVLVINKMSSGGAKGALVRLAAELGRRGHCTEIWSLYTDDRNSASPRSEWTILSRPARSLPDYALIFSRLVRELCRFRPDAVISFLPCSNVLGQAAALLAGVQSRVASQRQPAWSYGRILRSCDRMLGSLGLYTSNVVVSHSAWESFAGYPRRYVRALKVVRNGFSFQNSPLNPGEARAKFALPATAPLAITVGRLVPEKNQAVLLRALSLVPGVHLAIAGGGELANELCCLAKSLAIEDRVHFLGDVKPEDIFDLLRAADLFSLPSHFEGLSNALVEAMAAGLPVLVSDIPSQAEVVKPDGAEPAGLLIPAEDERAWAGAIHQILGDPSLRFTLADRARQRAALYTLDQMADGFEACIAQSVGALIGSENRLAD